MPLSGPLVRALYLYLKEHELASHGFLQELMQRTRQNAPLLSLTDARLLARAIDLADPRRNTPSLALRLGVMAPQRVLGLVGDLIVQCRTLRSAASASRSFLILLQAGGDLRILEAGERTMICYQPPPGSAWLRRFSTDFALALIASIARETFGRGVVPPKLLVPFERPAHASAYWHELECPVEFEAYQAAVEFDACSFETNQPFADLVLQQRIEERIRRTLPHSSRLMTVRDRVRTALAREVTVSSMQGVARQLGLSSRTLRTRLSSEGTSFGKLVTDFQRDRAKSLVGEDVLPIKVIAEQLGFSESSSFHRAFKRWTGVTPAQFRSRATSHPVLPRDDREPCSSGLHHAAR